MYLKTPAIADIFHTNMSVSSSRPHVWGSACEIYWLMQIVHIADHVSLFDRYNYGLLH